MFGPDGEIVTGSTYKPSPGIFGSSYESEGEERTVEQKKPVEKPQRKSGGELPQVPKDISVGFDMRSAR